MTKKRKRNKHRATSDPLLNISDQEVPVYLTTSLTTPSEIDRYVSQFCKKLSPKENPVFLNVQAPNWSRLSYCNKNIEKMKELHGGSMVLGYKIWYVSSFVY